MKKISSIITIVKKTVFIISLIVLIVSSFIAVSARFDIPGGLRIYSVLTGSMEPTVPVGSLIVSKIPTENRDIEKDQIITFEQPGFENKFVTHRVHEAVERGETRFFITKGDANDNPDSWLISYGRVKGIYQRHIPYLGYFLEFLRSPFGIALFILLPVSVLVIGELKNIGSILLEMKLQKEKFLLKGQKEAKKVKKKKSSKEILIIILFAFSLFSIPRTFALFASEPVKISSISIATGSWVNPDAPIISNVSHFIGTLGSPNQKKATVSWDTNESATSNLRWRTNPADPWTSLTVDTTADQTHHSRDIDGLLPETTYYVEVESADGAGNLATASYSFSTSDLRAGIDWLDDIVINEFLPNPIGDDAALMPEGEWVELYNRGSSVHNLENWYLLDADGNRLNLTLGNITSSDLSTTGFDIAPGEFMVVYRNGDTGFELNNDFGGDEVKLYSSTNELADQHSYSAAFGDEVLENKSIARYPDGTDNWFDPIPSPGGPNVLEVQPWPTPTPQVSPTASPLPTPSLEFSLRGDKKAVSFTVSNVNAFEKINYEIVYDSIGEDKGIVGSADLTRENTFSRNNLLLGTCSGIEGKVCVYDEGITKLRLKVTLVSGGVETVLEKEIDY